MGAPAGGPLSSQGNSARSFASLRALAPPWFRRGHPQQWPSTATPPLPARPGEVPHRPPLCHHKPISGCRLMRAVLVATVAVLGNSHWPDCTLGPLPASLLARGQQGPNRSVTQSFAIPHTSQARAPPPIGEQGCVPTTVTPLATGQHDGALPVSRSVGNRRTDP